MKNLENWNELKTVPIKVYLNVSENCQTPKQFVNLTHYDMTANWNVYIYIYIYIYAFLQKYRYFYLLYKYECF